MKAPLLAVAVALVFPLTTLADAAAGVKWTAPAAWKAEPERPMRVATYSIPSAPGDSDPAECAVFYFGAGQGGTVDANVQRWMAQFESADGKPVPSPPAKKEKIKDLQVTRLELDGTYLGMGGPMAAVRVKKPGYKLIGAVVEAPQGPVFFKMTGPAKTVTAARADFQKLLSSLSR